MSKKKIKSLFFTLGVVTPIVGFSMAITSCGPKKPDVDQVTITFDAGDGRIVSPQTGEKTISFEVDKGQRWSQFIQPEVFLDNEHPFDGWSLDGENPVPVDHIFNNDETFYALYTNHEHEYDIYGVDLLSNRMYVECSVCHERHYLTDTELESYENEVLVQNKDGTYTLSDRSLSDLITNPLPNATRNIHLIYGTYEIGGSSSSAVKVNINGLYDNENHMTSTINCYTSYPIGMAGIELTIFNTYMLGALKNEGQAFYFGIQSNKLNCYSCYFLGQQTIYADSAYFNGCIFDSSIFELYYDENEDIWKTEYALYLYNQYDEFENCDFVGKGKAVKIFSEGDQGGIYEFRDTCFTWVEHDDPDHPEQQLTADQFKACIQVDSSHLTGDNAYYIFYKNLLQDEHRQGVEVELYKDSADPAHSYFIEL